jgi:hypothetical protein
MALLGRSHLLSLLANPWTKVVFFIWTFVLQEKHSSSSDPSAGHLAVPITLSSSSTSQHSTAGHSTRRLSQPLRAFAGRSCKTLVPHWLPRAMRRGRELQNKGHGARATYNFLGLSALIKGVFRSIKKCTIQKKDFSSHQICDTCMKY